MKYLSILFAFVFIMSVTSAQIHNPVTWSYNAKKIDATTYEVHLTAVIDGKWHIYSQSTPDGGPVPTSIKFSANPLLTIQGSTKEIGKLEQHHEKLFGVDVKQFSGKVDFVQTVKLKAPVKTNVSGSVEFMACDNDKCLPPATQKFSIALK